MSEENPRGRMGSFIWSTSWHKH